jgi:hypothetical protein
VQLTIRRLALGLALVGGAVPGCNEFPQGLLTSGSPVVAVRMTPTGDTLGVGDTTQVVATPVDSSGQPLTGHAVTFSSSDPTVASVSPSGVVIALGTGWAAIVATSDGAVGTAAILVPACVQRTTLGVNDLTVTLDAGGVPGTPPPGAGVFYRGTGVIFAGGPVYGTGASDLVLDYDTNLGTSDIDSTRTEVCVLKSAPISYTYAKLRLSPGVNGPSGLQVTQESFAMPAPNNGFVLFRDVFTNTGASQITNFWSGFLFDWDLYFDGTPDRDLVHFDAGVGVGEVTESDTTDYPQVLGIVPIGAQGSASFHGFPPGSYSRSDYYGFLTGGVADAVTGPADVRELVGQGPLAIPVGGHVVVYFAVVGGANQAAFAANVAAARAAAGALGFK